MKVLVVGATGTIGAAVVHALAPRHTVIPASRSSEVPVDIRDEQSIIDMYDRVGSVDAVVSAAGGAPFVPLAQATAADFARGFGDKLGGQINLVLHGLPRISDGGSFTLITGVLAREPIATGVISSTVNGGLEAFVAAAAAELPPGDAPQRSQPIGHRRIAEQVRGLLPRLRRGPGFRRRKCLRQIGRRHPHRTHLRPRMTRCRDVDKMHVHRTENST